MNGAARSWIASLEIHLSDAEAHGAPFFLAEELIFPERRHAVNFERRAEALARFVDVHPAKEIANSLQALRGNNRWAVGDGVIRKSFGRIADGDRLLEELGKPLGGGCRVAWEGKCSGWNFAAGTRRRKPYGVDVRRESRADQVGGGGTLAVHPLTVSGIKRPGT